MTRQFFTILGASFGFILVCSMSSNLQSSNYSCDCDTSKAKKIITNKNFNRIPQYDTSTFAKLDFYKLDTNINRLLWYRDVENIDTTKFTNLWNDYSFSNYHASNLDFVKFYDRKKDIELAFQFGPNMDLWAYHIFVIKKVGCCFLVTRSYFRHARFTYKAYSIINDKKVNLLYSIINKINTQSVGNKEEFEYRGYFVDNRNDKKFFIDFEKEKKKEVNELYDFVDKKINWIITYNL